MKQPNVILAARSSLSGSGVESYPVDNCINSELA
jgi:hypothetical protein